MTLTVFVAVLAAAPLCPLFDLFRCTLLAANLQRSYNRKRKEIHLCIAAVSSRGGAANKHAEQQERQPGRRQREHRQSHRRIAAKACTAGDNPAGILDRALR